MERAADRKPVVVVVEDEQLLRMTAIEMVEKAGFEAIEAIDADEAIPKVETTFEQCSWRLSSRPRRSTNAGLPNEKAPPERGWCGRGSIMSRTNLCLSPYGYAGAGRNLLVFGSFSALKPSHSHPIPRGFASGISGGLGHLLALGGVFQKFVSWIDRCHRRSLLGFPVPMDTIEWRTKRATAS
jgi:hypothetical protein